MLNCPEPVVDEVVPVTLFVTKSYFHTFMVEADNRTFQNLSVQHRVAVVRTRVDNADISFTEVGNLLVFAVASKENGHVTTCIVDLVDGEIAEHIERCCTFAEVAVPERCQSGGCLIDNIADLLKIELTGHEADEAIEVGFFKVTT